MRMKHGLAWPLVVSAVSLSAQTSDLKWHKDVQKDAAEAERVAASDPVSAFRLLQAVQKGKKPTAPQAAWLEQRFTELRPKAIEVLQRDYDAAGQAGDLRGVLLAAANAEAIASNSLRKQPSPEDVRKKALAADPAAGIWKISELAAATAKGYASGGMSGFSVVVPKGSHVLRVRARVENAADGTDPSYAIWAFGPLKRLLGSISSTSEPHRWLDQDLVFLVDPAGELINCAVIGKDSDLATIEVRTAAGQVAYPPKALKKGESAKLDAVFVVPQAAAEYRLFVVGGSPVALPAPTAS